MGAGAQKTALQRDHGELFVRLEGVSIPLLVKTNAALDAVAPLTQVLNYENCLLFGKLANDAHDLFFMYLVM